MWSSSDLQLASEGACVRTRAVLVQMGGLEGEDTLIVCFLEGTDNRDAQGWGNIFVLQA